jgi:hypothetical protein
MSFFVIPIFQKVAGFSIFTIERSAHAHTYKVTLPTHSSPTPPSSFQPHTEPYTDNLGAILGALYC